MVSSSASNSLICRDSLHAGAHRLLSCCYRISIVLAPHPLPVGCGQRVGREAMGQHSTLERMVQVVVAMSMLTPTKPNTPGANNKPAITWLIGLFIGVHSSRHATMLARKAKPARTVSEWVLAHERRVSWQRWGAVNPPRNGRASFGSRTSGLVFGVVASHRAWSRDQSASARVSRPRRNRRPKVAPCLVS